MNGSSFPFIRNDILRQNLDEAFGHIIVLLSFTESSTYTEPAKSAFRKTIIIYTASIIEALLFYLLDKSFSNKEVAEHYSTWELKNKKLLFTINEAEEIVAGTYKKVSGKDSKDKMNLGQISDFLKIKGILTDDLAKEVDEMRKLRNHQHISTHKEVKLYTKIDLEKAFSTAGKVKEFVKNNQ